MKFRADVIDNENPGTVVFSSGSEFLEVLRKFYAWETSKNVYPERFPSSWRGNSCYACSGLSARDCGGLEERLDHQVGYPGLESGLHERHASALFTGAADQRVSPCRETLERWEFLVVRACGKQVWSPGSYLAAEGIHHREGYLCGYRQGETDR